MPVDEIAEAYSAARKCGVHDAEFWTLTPYLLRLAVAAEGERLHDEHIAAVHVAWHTANLTHADPRRMPGIDRYLGIKPKPTKNAAVQDRAILKRMLGV